MCSHTIILQDSLFNIISEKIKILDILHRDSNQGKIARETATAGWVWPGLILIKYLSHKLTMPIINT